MLTSEAPKEFDGSRIRFWSKLLTLAWSNTADEFGITSRDSILILLI